MRGLIHSGTYTSKVYDITASVMVIVTSTTTRNPFPCVFPFANALGNFVGKSSDSDISTSAPAN